MDLRMTSWPSTMRRSSSRLTERGELTEYAQKDGAKTWAAKAKLLAPAVDSVDAEANSAFDDVNAPLETIGTEGEIFIRGVKYTLTTKVANSSRTVLWTATRDPEAIMHDVRSSLVRGGTIDRSNPRLNKETVLVNIVRFNHGDVKDELMSCEASMSTGKYSNGVRIFSAAGPEEFRREVQMHARAQHYTAVSGAPGAIELLATSSTKQPVKVHKNWLEGAVPESQPYDAAGFPTEGEEGMALGWALLVCENAEHGTLHNMMKRKPKDLFFGEEGDAADGAAGGAPPALARQHSATPAVAGQERRLLIDSRDERCVKWIAKALLLQIGQLHKHGIMHHGISIKVRPLWRCRSVRIASQPHRAKLTHHPHLRASFARALAN